MAGRRVSIKFSGVSGQKKDDIYHDGKMSVEYCYAFSRTSVATYGDFVNGKVAYTYVFPDYAEVAGLDDSTPMMLNYMADDTYGVTKEQGLFGIQSNQGNTYSFYRREYEVYQRPGLKIKGYYNSVDGKFYSSYNSSGPAFYNKINDNPNILYIDILTNYLYKCTKTSTGYVYSVVDAVRVYKGEWEPAAVKLSSGYFRDYNITNGRSYQYIMYTTDEMETSAKQIFANYSGKIWVEDSDNSAQGYFSTGTWETAHQYGEPVTTSWDYWSIVELDVIDNAVDAPAIKRTYKANLDQLWIFKYSLETGSQTQNIARSDFQSLGEYIKVGYGPTNYDSGEVTALLGSEIIPYSEQGYVERLAKSRNEPLSTNEKVKMLAQWRKFVSSKKPKLLRDIKGQSWIVQIFSSSNSPKNFYLNQPDTITFQWKQIYSTDDIIVYGDVTDTTRFENYGSEQWEGAFKNKNFND